MGVSITRIVARVDMLVSMLRAIQPVRAKKNVVQAKHVALVSAALTSLHFEPVVTKKVRALTIWNAIAANVGFPV